MVTSSEAWNLLGHVRRESSTNEKKRILATKDLSKYLLYAYHPYWKYHQRQITLPEPGVQDFDPTTWFTLDRFRKRVVTGNNAKFVLDNQLRMLNMASQQMLKAIILKDLRAGISVKTINAVYPDLIPEWFIMKAEEYDESRAEFPCFLEPKFNGIRVRYESGQFFSSGGRLWRSLDYIGEQWGKTLPDIKLEAEAIVPGVSFEVSSGYIRGHRRLKFCNMHVFDVVDTVNTYTARRRYLDNLWVEYAHAAPGYSVVQSVLVHNHAEVMGYYHNMLKAGLEGAMVKMPNHLYRGGRYFDWMKLKEVQTLDARIINVYPGEPDTKYASLLGGCVGETEDGTIVRIGGGWSDAERRLYYHSPEKIIGKWVEVAYQHKTDTADRKLRHPRKVRMREDLA